MKLDLAEIKRIFRLNADNGIVYWQVTTGQRGQCGDIAGTTKPNKGRYLAIQYKGRKHKTHQIVYALHNDVWPPGNIDHIDGNTYNNRPENLRIASQSENNRNAKNRKDNKSGVRGVCWHPNKKVWVVQISVEGKAKHIGAAASFMAAVTLRKSAEKMYDYHPNHGRG